MMNSIVKSGLILFFVLSNIIFSQTFNLQSVPKDITQLGFQFEKGFLASDTELSTLSGSYQINCNIPISSKFNLIGNIPFITSSYEQEDYGYGSETYSESGFGNVFVGLQTNPEIINNKKSFITFGAFLPTAEEDVSIIGIFFNYYDIQKYLPNSFGLYFNFAHHVIKDEGFNYGMEIGPNLLIPTKESSLDTEMFLHYGVNAGYQIYKLSLNMELLGLVFVTQDVNEFDDRFIHSLNFGASWKERTFTPKIFYKIYLKEEMSDMIDGVLGIGVTVSLD